MSLKSNFYEPKKVKLGRKSSVAKHPEIITIATQVVHDNGLVADMKRGAQTPLRVGSTHKDIQSALIEGIPSLKEDFPNYSTSIYFFS